MNEIVERRERELKAAVRGFLPQIRDAYLLGFQRAVLMLLPSCWEETYELAERLLSDDLQTGRPTWI